MDYSPPGSTVHGISQARILEWVDISFSRGCSCPRDQTHVSCLSCIAGEFFTTEPPGKLTTVYLKLKMKVKVKLLSHVWLFAIPWTVACQAPWDFPGKNTGVGWHFLLQGIFLTQGSNPGHPHCRQTLDHLSHQGILVFYHLEFCK